MEIEFPPHERALLDAYRSELGISIEREAELLRGLEQIELPPSGPNGGGIAAPRVALIRGAIGTGLVAVAALVLILGRPDNQSEPAAAAPRVQSEQPALVVDDPLRRPALPTSPERDLEPTAALPTPALAPTPSSPESATPPKRTRPARVKPAPALADTSSVESDLAAELELMKRVRQALARGAHAEVAVLTREHEQRFAAGVFRDEREVSRAEALCSSGAIEQGSALAQAFLQHKARSPLAARLRRSCALDER